MRDLPGVQTGRLSETASHFEQVLPRSRRIARVAGMSAWEVFLQQLIIGLSNGMIIALIALGYTMVYGIIELINFAHGDLFTLGCFCALTLVGALGLERTSSVVVLLAIVPVFCGGL